MLHGHENISQTSDGIGGRGGVFFRVPVVENLPIVREVSEPFVISLAPNILRLFGH